VDSKLWLVRILPESSYFPTSSDQQKVAGSHFQPFSSNLSVPTFQFQLITSGFFTSALFTQTAFCSA
jgi:hypothetical protein